MYCLQGVYIDALGAIGLGLTRLARDEPGSLPLGDMLRLEGSALTVTLDAAWAALQVGGCDKRVTFQRM